MRLVSYLQWLRIFNACMYFEPLERHMPILLHKLISCYWYKLILLNISLISVTIFFFLCCLLPFSRQLRGLSRGGQASMIAVRVLARLIVLVFVLFFFKLAGLWLFLACSHIVGMVFSLILSAYLTTLIQKSHSLLAQWTRLIRKWSFLDFHV